MHKRTTIYLDPKLHQAIKMKAVRKNSNVLELIDEAIRLFLKDNIFKRVFGTDE